MNTLATGEQIPPRTTLRLSTILRFRTRQLAPIFTSEVRLHLTEHSNALLPSLRSRHAGCIRCRRGCDPGVPPRRQGHSPRGAVPVNLGKPCCNAWSDFRQEFGKNRSEAEMDSAACPQGEVAAGGGVKCDSIHAMRQAGSNRIARQYDLDPTWPVWQRCAGWTRT